MPQMIGSLEASQILGVDRATITRWALEGRLAYQRLPGQTGAYVFDRADVEKLAREKAAAS
jgi:excisionase family DNA binding protein